MASVCEFYKDKSILITGATGFLGKVLVEKLLRSCPDVEAIYLLLRPKKGLDSNERLRELCNNKVFDTLRQTRPEAFKKLKLVSGDILDEDLGLSTDDREELKNKCNVIFHSAACVRFDQKLKDAVHLNTTGTLRVLKLAESMKDLKVFVHLSTAYCRCELDELEEKLYPAVHKPADIMKIVEWMDDGMLDYLQPKIISPEPNTYAYTKAITEEMVAEYSDKFPVAIARPSIVTAALKEPKPGWIDNINGPTGLIIGSGKGVIRSMHCEPSYSADAMPVDVVVNGCILIGYTTALEKSKETKIYNVTLSQVMTCTWGDMIKLGKKWVNEYPFTVALWYPGGSIKSYWLSHYICHIFLHLLPAYIVDALLYLLGKKTFMVNIQKRVSHGLNILQYYTTKEWHFRNSNFRSLRKRISEDDNRIFYTDLSNIDIDDYLKNYILGAREFCCKEDPANIPRARKLNWIRYIIDRVLKIIQICLIILVVYKYFYIITDSVEYLDSSLKNLTPKVKEIEGI